MQPMMPGYGWGNQNAWQPYPAPIAGNNGYWPSRNSGFNNHSNNNNNNNNSNAVVPHPGSRSGSFRMQMPQQPQPPQLQQLPPQQSFRYPQMQGMAEDASRLPPLTASPSPPQLASSGHSSQHDSFRQHGMSASSGTGMTSLYGSFRRVPSANLNRPPPPINNNNNMAGSFRQPMAMGPPAPPPAISPPLARDRGHLAPLESPVAELPDSESPTNSEGLAQEKLEIQKELSQLMGRKTSSRRILRRKVSFQGIRMTEEERRLQGELQRLREEEDRRNAAEMELREQRLAQEQQERERQRAQALQEQQDRYYAAQRQPTWSPQLGLPDDSDDEFRPGEYDLSQSTTPMSMLAAQQQQHQQPMMTPNSQMMAMHANQAGMWNSFRVPQQMSQQQPMYGMCYGGQLPPVPRFPQQNGFQMKGSPPMIGSYPPQPQQVGRRF